MKRILFTLLSAFLLTMVGSLDMSAQRGITITKKVNIPAPDKTCNMRYLIGQTSDGASLRGTEFDGYRYGYHKFCSGRALNPTTGEWDIIPTQWNGQGEWYTYVYFFFDISGKNHNWAVFLNGSTIVDVQPYHYYYAFDQTNTNNFNRSFTIWDFEVDWGQTYPDPNLMVNPNLKSTLTTAKVGGLNIRLVK